MPNIWYVASSPIPSSAASIFIGRDLIFLPLLRAMTRDERFYPQPEEFLPDRHLNKSGDGLAQDRELPSAYVFGFGRR